MSTKNGRILMVDDAQTGRRASLQLADTLDAITSGRPSRKGRPVAAAPEGVIGNTDWELFQPESAGRIVENERRIMERGETESSSPTHGSSRINRIGDAS